MTRAERMLRQIQEDENSNVHFIVALEMLLRSDTRERGAAALAPMQRILRTCGLGHYVEHLVLYRSVRPINPNRVSAENRETYVHMMNTLARSRSWGLYFDERRIALLSLRDVAHHIPQILEDPERQERIRELEDLQQEISQTYPTEIPGGYVDDIIIELLHLEGTWDAARLHETVSCDVDPETGQVVDIRRYPVLGMERRTYRIERE